MLFVGLNCLLLPTLCQHAAQIRSHLNQTSGICSQIEPICIEVASIQRTLFYPTVMKCHGNATRLLQYPPTQCWLTRQPVSRTQRLTQNKKLKMNMEYFMQLLTPAIFFPNPTRAQHDDWKPNISQVLLVEFFSNYFCCRLSETSAATSFTVITGKEVLKEIIQVTHIQ